MGSRLSALFFSMLAATALAELEPRTAISASNTPGDSDSMFKISSPGPDYLTANGTRSSTGAGIHFFGSSSHGALIQGNHCADNDLGIWAEGTSAPNTLNTTNPNDGFKNDSGGFRQPDKRPLGLAGTARHFFFLAGRRQRVRLCLT